MLTFSIAAYKESPYLEELILSLQSQTIPCELIITTSTPNEHIRNLAKKYQIDKIFINSSKKQHITNDMNFALSCAKTKYCVIAHQDDIYKKDFAEKLLQEAEKYPDNIITFPFYAQYRKGKIIDNSRLLKIKSIILNIAFRGNSYIRTKLLKKAMLMLGSPIPCPGVMFNLHNIKDFKFSNDFKIDFDWNAWLDLAQEDGSFVFINEQLMLHRIHNKSATFTGINDNQRYIEDKKMLSKLWYTPFDKLVLHFYTLSYKDNINL